MWVRILCFLTLGASGCANQGARLVDIDRPRSVPSNAVADAHYALTVAGAIARGAWDDWRPGLVPFVIVYPDEQWMFRSSSPFPGYDLEPAASRLGPAYRAPSWTRYDGVRVAFSPPWFFAQADRRDEALTFTIAAPSVAPFPASDWATVFTHEYFHTFQMTDPRWTGDSPLIAQANRRRLSKAYQENLAVRTSVSRELDRYASLLRPGAPLACDDLDVVAVARQTRFNLLNEMDPELPEAERALERIEGIARYVEESAYDLDDVARIFRTREPSWTSAPVDKTIKRRLGVTDGEYYYATGYALARILDTCNPSWKKYLGGKDLFELTRISAERDPMSITNETK